MFADLKGIFFGREAVKLVAVRQLAGKGWEVILMAVAPVGLEPGENLAYRLHRQAGNQT